jgi:hypothetical protein
MVIPFYEHKLANNEGNKMAKASISKKGRSKTNAHWVELDRKYRAQVRKTRSIVLERGKGVEVWDVEGNGPDDDDMWPQPSRGSKAYSGAD